MLRINSCNRMTMSFGLAVVFAISAQSPACAGDSASPVITSPLWSAQPTTLVDAQGRTFQNGTVKFSGTLYAPKVEGRVPAVIVFHAASSPTRDVPLHRHLVEMLPPLGIAVFVFDRRGSGKSGGKLEDSDYTMLADDGIAAQRMLADDSQIDARRIGFWGLSQGGWLSLLAASRNPQAAFAISISAPMTTPDVQMNFAVANILRIRGFTQADIDQAIGTRTAVDDFMRGKRDRASTQKILDAATTKPWFEHIYMSKTFKDPDQSRWAKEMRHDPLATLDAVKMPALVIYGSADPWVPAKTSIERLRASSARHPNIEVAVVAGADHAMATSVSAADQIDPVLSAKEAPQSTEYFGLLGAWLAKQGLARVP
jgi:pimeloyl-ACP methyl ester carboxylesterase